MNNQLLQVKTQVTDAIADQHLLEKKQKENEEKVTGMDAQGRACRRSRRNRSWHAALCSRVEAITDFGELSASRQKAQVEVEAPCAVRREVISAARLIC